jgi:hypothetical protein
LAALAVTAEMLKGGALELAGETFTDPTHAVVRVRTGTREAKLPMYLGAGGWRLVVPEQAIDGIARRLAGNGQ